MLERGRAQARVAIIFISHNMTQVLGFVIARSFFSTAAWSVTWR
jgi:hypothetical protein